MHPDSLNQSQPKKVLARAPGKLLIAGEFAVLEGAPALVIAINRHARAALADAPIEGQDPASPLHKAVAEAMQVNVREVNRLKIDTSALFQDGRKLGLGSSSAACTAAVAALGEPSYSRHQTFELAMNAHRRLQSGLGSGFDVAASTHGGALIYRQGTEPSRVDLPAGFFWRAFSWNRPSSTRRAIERWRVVRDHKRLLQAAHELPRSARSNADELFDAIDDLQHRLLELDRAHTLGIAAREQHLLAARANDVAEEYSTRVLFKQSGAGGGDVSIAISTSFEALQALSNIAVQWGLEPLDLKVDMQGVVRE